MQVTVVSGIQMDEKMGAGKYYMLRPLDYSRHQACSRRREGRLFTQALFTSKKAHGKTGFAWEISFSKEFQ